MSEDTISVYYNKVSGSYDTGRVASIETIEKLVRLLNIGNSSVILDMGCGTGNYTCALQPVAESVIGIDMSTGMLEQARVKHDDLLCGDVTHLPFAAETFDGVIAMQVLHHVSEKEQFLSEAHRVLQKGTSIAINTCSHQQIRTFWLYHYFPGGLAVDLGRIPDSPEIATLLVKAGFCNVGIEICYQNMAKLYMQTGDIIAARSLIKSAKELLGTLNSPALKVDLAIIESKCTRLSGNPDKAQAILNEALEIA